MSHRRSNGKTIVRETRSTHIASNRFGILTTGIREPNLRSTFPPVPDYLAAERGVKLFYVPNHFNNPLERGMVAYTE